MASMTASVIEAKCFVPAAKAGSCFGARSATELDVELRSLKGLQADLVWHESFQCNRFRYPLCLTEVALDSEAARRGLRKGDTVRAVRSGRGELIKVTSTSVLPRGAAESVPTLVVSEEVNRLLLSDDVSAVHVTRAQGQRCGICEQAAVEEVEDSLDHRLVCTACGHIAVQSLMSAASEWRSFADDDGPEKSRVGRMTAADAALSGTCIAESGSTASKQLLWAQRHTNAQQRTNAQHDARNKSELELHQHVDRLCARMDLTGAIPATAQHMASQLLLKRASLGFKRRPNMGLDALAASCVHGACDQLGLHRTVKEMLAGAGCEPKRFKSALSLLKKTLPCSSVAPPDARALVARFCCALRLSPALQRAVDAALATAPAALRDHHLPATMAAAAIARAAAVPPSRAAEVSGAASSTVLAVVRAWHRLQPSSLPPAPAPTVSAPRPLSPPQPHGAPHVAAPTSCQPASPRASAFSSSQLLRTTGGGAESVAAVMVEREEEAVGEEGAWEEFGHAGWFSGDSDSGFWDLTGL